MQKRSAAATWLLSSVLGVACHPATPARPPEAGDAQVRVSLEAEPALVTPGATVSARARFRVAPGWHIYAEDPGDSGLPTRVAITAPPGFRVGRTVYPPAQAFVLPGNIRNNGYEREAVLTVPVEAPAALPGRTVVLRARLSWLACSEACIPGSADLALTLPTLRPQGEASRRSAGLPTRP